VAVLWILPSISVLRGETTWDLVTDASTLAVGDQIIIASSQKDFAMSTTQNANNRGQAEIYKTEGHCTLSADVQVITLVSGTISNTFALSVGDGYLYAASSSNNYLKTQAEIDANGSFLIAIDEGNTLITAQGSNSNNTFRYNSSSKLFACYATGDASICIYKNPDIVHHTITYNENGVTSQNQCVEGEIVALKAPSEINGFVAQGWTLSPMTPSDTPPADLTNSFTVTNDVTFYAVYALEESGDFEKIASPILDYSGTYLIVNEDYGIAFNGSFDVLDIPGNTISVDIFDDEISSNSALDAATFTISKIADEYQIRSASGYNIGRTASNSGMNVSATTVYTNTIDIDGNGDAVVTASNSMVLRYTNTSGQKRFRYYPGTQQPIQLYKKAAARKRCFCTSIDIISEPLTITENTTWGSPTSLYNTLTISAGAMLTTNCLGNKNAANIIVEDGGELECNAGVFGTLLKEIEASSQWGDEVNASDGWYGISSPIAGRTETASVSGLYVGGSNDYDLYSYSEEGSVWLNAKDEENPLPEMSAGTGYLYASKEGSTIQFSGELNAKYVNKNIGYSSDNEALRGFNLIGNPFPKRITLSNIDGMDFGGFYAATNAGAWEAHVGTEEAIRPCEALLVQAAAAGQIRLLKNPTHASKGSEADKYISVKVENSYYEDVAYIFLSPETEKKLSKIPHQNNAIPSLSINGNAVVSFDEDISGFDVSLKIPTTGKYKIGAKMNGQAKNELSYLHLFDKMTGEDIDLLIDESHEFIGSPRDIENRFAVKLRQGSADADYKNLVHQSGNTLIVSGSGTLQLIDMLGRVVISQNINGENINVDNLEKGVYIVKMIGSEVKTQKVIIR